MPVFRLCPLSVKSRALCVHHIDNDKRLVIENIPGRGIVRLGWIRKLGNGAYLAFNDEIVKLCCREHEAVEALHNSLSPF